MDGSLLPRDRYGARLHELRAELDKSLAEIAAAVGVTKGAVWKWEQGWTRPGLAHLVPLALALEVKPAEIKPPPLAHTLHRRRGALSLAPAVTTFVAMSDDWTGIRLPFEFNCWAEYHQWAAGFAVGAVLVAGQELWLRLPRRRRVYAGGPGTYTAPAVRGGPAGATPGATACAVAGRRVFYIDETAA